MKDEPRSPVVKHQLQHVVPTVIHNPEEDLNLLARWLRRAMDNPTRFWSLLGALVLVVVGLAVLGSGISLGRAQSDEAWNELQNTKTPSERAELAEKFPKSPAAQWALLQSAAEFYEKGFLDLPQNRDAAEPQLRKAIDLFQKVADETPDGDPMKRAALLGLARSLEASNKLDRAIEKYELVAKTWPDTADAKLARETAETLRKPESVAFYKQLYEFKPMTATLPPAGEGNPFSLPLGHPPVGGVPDASSLLPPSLLPPTPTKSDSEKTATKDEMPAPVLLPPPPPKDKAATEPGSTDGSTPKAELPPDVFAPPAKSKP